MHEGLFARVAKQLGIDCSYVSRVAKGERTSERILNAIVTELRRIERQWSPVDTRAGFSSIVRSLRTF